MKPELSARWFPLMEHPVQQALWETPARFVAVPAGRGSGKTELAKRRLVRWLPVRKGWSDPRYFYAGPTEKQAKRVAWNDLLALIPKGWISAISLSDHRISTIFGSELWVVGLDQPQRIEGVQWDGGVLDESSDLKPGVFDLNVLPALTHRKGWCWRIGVPKRQGVGAAEYRDFYERAVRGEIPGAAGYTWPSKDIVPAEALDAARRAMDPKDFREQFEAAWETAGGAVFFAFDRKFNVRPCQYDHRRPLVVGSDFNVDPMAWAIGHVYPDRAEWFDELWLRDANTQMALDVLWSRYSSHDGGFEFYGDASGQGRHTSASVSDVTQIANDPRFVAAGRTLQYTPSNPPVADRFAACNAMFCNAAGERRMFVAPNCRALIADLEARHYHPGTKDAADKGDLGHITDAMGYAVYARFPIRLDRSKARRVVAMTGYGAGA